MSEGFTEAGRPLTRRHFIAGATAMAAGGLVASVAAGRAFADAPVPLLPLGTQPTGLPARQHAWAEYLPVDKYGNPQAPKYDKLILFDVKGQPTQVYQQFLESRLRTLERRFRWGPEGLLFTVSWGPSYYGRYAHIPSPVPRATALSSFETPAIDSYDACIHLACNDAERLAQIEAALVRGRPLPGVAGSLSVAPILIWRETRTGFTGAGIPAANQHVQGIPDGKPVPASAPLFMGFKSGLKKNQATEDDITIPNGPFAEGTTMQVSYMRLKLDDWYGKLSDQDRVARMYSPQTTVADVRAITTDAPSEPQAIPQAIKQYGVIGHAQAAAQARRANRPLIIRRDFDTVDGGYAGLHFVSVQKSIDDFVVTRNAMNAAGAHLANPAITATANNGINAFISVRRRANYFIPARAVRAFPKLHPDGQNGAPSPADVRV
jgi:hypothetical protein